MWPECVCVCVCARVVSRKRVSLLPFLNSKMPSQLDGPRSSTALIVTEIDQHAHIMEIPNIRLKRTSAFQEQNHAWKESVSNCRNVYSSWVQKKHIPFMQIREITAVFDRLS